MNDKDKWIAQRAETGIPTHLSQADAAFREQRVELVRMISELRTLQDAVKKQQGSDVQALKRENEELRSLLLGPFESALLSRGRSYRLTAARLPPDAGAAVYASKLAGAPLPAKSIAALEARLAASVPEG